MTVIPLAAVAIVGRYTSPFRSPVPPIRHWAIPVIPRSAMAVVSVAVAVPGSPIPVISAAIPEVTRGGILAVRHPARGPVRPDPVRSDPV